MRFPCEQPRLASLNEGGGAIVRRQTKRPKTSLRAFQLTEQLAQVSADLAAVRIARVGVGNHESVRQCVYRLVRFSHPLIAEGDLLGRSRIGINLKSALRGLQRILRQAQNADRPGLVNHRPVEREIQLIAEFHPVQAPRIAACLHLPQQFFGVLGIMQGAFGGGARSGSEQCAGHRRQ